MLDVMVILDRSGSMQSARSDHEGGIRSFVEDQRRVPGEARFTFIQFDTENPCEVVYDRVPFDAVKEITLVPRGGTPLLDALGKALAHLQAAQAATPAAHTLVMVVTDGQENASREWTKEQIRKRVEELTATGTWTFLYLGANVDAFAEADSMGIAAATSAGYRNKGQQVNHAYSIASSNLRSARVGGLTGQSVSSAMAFTDEDRATLNAEDEEPERHK